MMVLAAGVNEMTCAVPVIGFEAVMGAVRAAFVTWADRPRAARLGGGPSAPRAARLRVVLAAGALAGALAADLAVVRGLAADLTGAFVLVCDGQGDTCGLICATCPFERCRILINTAGNVAVNEALDG